MAAQWKSLSAAIMPATTLVLPTLRECPPMTTIAIRVLSQVLTRFNTPMMIGTSGNRVIGEPGHRKIRRAWALSVNFIAPGNESDFPMARLPDHQMSRSPPPPIPHALQCEHRDLERTLRLPLSHGNRRPDRAGCPAGNAASRTQPDHQCAGAGAGGHPDCGESRTRPRFVRFHPCRTVVQLFFIGPFYSLRISRPEDLVAFLVFVATAILVGQMSSRLEKRVIQTEVQQQQLERVRVDYQRASAEAAEAGELRRSEQLKTALLDAITHDLRTPLTSIKAAISTIRQKPVPGEVEQELYEVIEQEADRLNHFIQGMMDLAQLEAGRVTLDSRQVSAEAIVEDAMLRAEPLLAGHKVTISVEPDLPALRVDPRLISQVIYSLLENTARYSGPGDRIEVAVERSAENFVRFSVADEGPGIAPELRSQVFQTFFRAGGQAAFVVGLAIAHGIVHAHRRRICIEHRLREPGTNVKFEIPAGDQA